jgi:hypothetical protein
MIFSIFTVFIVFTIAYGDADSAICDDVGEDVSSGRAVVDDDGVSERWI